MYGYLKARPTKRNAFWQQQHQITQSNPSDLAVRTQSAGYLSWESISYFFGRLWTNDLYVDPDNLPPNKKLVETEVDSDLNKEKRRQDLLGLLGIMENTMEYKVTAFDTLPKIALKFNVTPSELCRLNKLTFRTLYPGQILRVPHPKSSEPQCLECSEALKEATNAPPQSMTMENRGNELSNIPVAKRVSFEDIDEDVLETFIKIKSKYITDGQGVVKGILLVTPHAVIFHPDVSEILVVDRGNEYYKVHFMMESVSCAGMFDDIASMVVHDTLQPGHFFLDKPIMQWLAKSDTKVLEKIKEEDSSSTLLPSNDSSLCQEQSMESLSETAEGGIQKQLSVEISSSVAQVDKTNDGLRETNELQAAAAKVEMDTESSIVKNDSEREETNGQSKNLFEGMRIEKKSQRKSITSSCESDSSVKNTSLEKDINVSQDRTSHEQSTQSMNSEERENNIAETSCEVSLGEKVCSDTDNNGDIILSSSQNPGLPKADALIEGVTGESEDVMSTESSLPLYSTPKLPSYRDVMGEQGIEVDKEEYTEGISRDSGIHESKEDVHEGDSDDHRWIDQEDGSSLNDVVPRHSEHFVDMPKYLCVKIKKACWREYRPICCRFAHEAIQQTVDERREFWFSIPSDRLLEVYGFFLERCPAIHDGDTDDDDLPEDFVNSLDSDYSVVSNPLDDDEVKKYKDSNRYIVMVKCNGSCHYNVTPFEVVDDFFSTSPEKENVHNNRHNRKRTHSREKKTKKKSVTKEPERKASSWSMCSVEEPVMPDVIGKSEILNDTHFLQLSPSIPPRLIGRRWNLVYSTYLHGISLKTLYRTLADYDTPALLVILDDCHQVFGAFVSSPFARSEHFYGTGECFLYKFNPQFKAFRWSGANNFFIKGDTDSLALGGGQGNFGLWLDEDLYHGSSHVCKTFNNEPLTVKEDFLCSGVEVWCFE